VLSCSLELRTEERNAKRRAWRSQRRAGRAALSDRSLPILSLSLSLSFFPSLAFPSFSVSRSSYLRDSSLPKLLDSRRSGIVDGDNLPSGREGEGKSTILSDSRGIAFQPRKREYRDPDESPLRPAVLHSGTSLE